jgi:hypothetical protein
MIAANVASGRWKSKGVNQRIVTPTITAVTTDEKPVIAPAVKLTAEREKEP